MKVKTIQTHTGIYGLKKVGDEYETSDLHAAELKRNGLVEADVVAAAKVEGDKILVTDKKDTVLTTTAIAGNAEPGKMATVGKVALEKGKKEANKSK